MLIFKKIKQSIIQAQNPDIEREKTTGDYTNRPESPAPCNMGSVQNGNLCPICSFSHYRPGG